MIYLDHNATTHMHPSSRRLVDELLLRPMNPSAIHKIGREGKSVIEKARRQLAELLGVRDNMRDYRITFTASGTEASNIVIQNFRDGEIFAANFEHSSISKPTEELGNVNIVDVCSNGLIDLEDLERKLSLSTTGRKLVSLMIANNETGIIQPVKEAAKIARKYGAMIHSDAVQGVGKIPIDFIGLDVDFITVSGHKFGGGTGAGALIFRDEIHMKPIIYGGGQERSLRSGTENVLAIAAMGEAAARCKADLAERAKQMRQIRDYLEVKLLEKMPNTKIVGQEIDRIPNTTLILNSGKDAETLVISLDLKGFAISSGSACSSGKVGESATLRSMGYSLEEMKSAIRVSVSYNTTIREIDKFLQAFGEINK